MKKSSLKFFGQEKKSSLKFNGQEIKEFLKIPENLKRSLKPPDPIIIKQDGIGLLFEIGDEIYILARFDHIDGFLKKIKGHIFYKNGFDEIHITPDKESLEFLKSLLKSEME